MGLFGGIGKALKGMDWGRVLSGAQQAGAIAHGDYGTAAQIGAYRRKQQDDEAQSQAEQQQRAALVAAAAQMGVPPAQANSLPTQQLAGLVSQQYTPRAPSEFDRTLIAAGIDPNSPQGRQLYSQRAATMASPAPQMIGTPETGYRFVTPPAPSLPSQQPAQQAGGPQPGAVVNGYRFRGGDPNNQASWEPVAGGAGSNAGGGFRNYPRY